MTSIKVLFANSASSILIHNKHKQISCIVTDVMVTRMRGPALISRVSPFPGPRVSDDLPTPGSGSGGEGERRSIAQFYTQLPPVRSSLLRLPVWVRVITEKCDHTRETESKSEENSEILLILFSVSLAVWLWIQKSLCLLVCVFW